MTEKLTMEELAKDIHDRLESIGAAVSEERITEIVRGMLPDLVQDEEFVRKMRFGGYNPNAGLLGTKYARWGLTIEDVEFLHDLQSSLIGQKRVGGSGVYHGPSEELDKTFRTISDAVYMTDEQVRAIDRQAIDDFFPRIPLAWFSPEDRKMAGKGAYELTGAYQRAIRAMDTAESGYGQQLTGQQYVSSLWEAARQQSRIFALLDTFEMTAPTAFLPVEADLPEMLFVSETTAAPASATEYATSKSGSQRVQVDAKKFVIHQAWSGELEEDSIIPFIPFIRRQAQISLSHYSDSVVLNGDDTNTATGNINLDDADPADTKHYLAFDGIRHVGLVDVTSNQKDLAAAGIGLADLKAVKGRMLDLTNLMDWGHPVNPADLVFVADPETADNIGLLDEVVKSNQLRSRPLLTGEFADILGHPGISSIAMSKTEADGKVSTTAANNTLGQVAAFNRNGFVVGWRRRVKLETERLPATDQTRIVHSLRLAFGRYSPTGAASGIEAADVIFNITI